MEANPNNTPGQSQDRNNSTANSNMGGGSSGNAGGSSGMGNSNPAQNRSTSPGSSSSSQSAQGRSNQQGTSGKDSMKNIQDMLQKYSGPITQKISSLTTTQKVVGGSLLALGAGWLALSSNSKNKIKSKASDLKSTAQHKINKKKKDSASDRSSSSNATSSRSGSSAIDARVK